MTIAIAFGSNMRCLGLADVVYDLVFRGIGYGSNDLATAGRLAMRKSVNNSTSRHFQPFLPHHPANK